jgi:hypothetical protein
LRRFAIISLVPLLLFNTVGYYLVFYGDILAARHEAEVFIWGHDSRSEKVVALTFAMADGKPVAEGLTFTDDDEFVYQGRMYDVISTTTHDGYITLRCYTDSRETALNDNLCHKINSDNESPAHNRKNNVLKEFTKDYTPHRLEIFCIIPVTVTSHTAATGGMPLPSVYRTVISPPPERCA